MPYYRISYKLPTSRLVSGIKQFHIKNIDDTFLHFNEKALKLQPDLVDFDCVMIFEKSKQYLDWLAAKQGHRWNNSYSGDGRIQGPGKYRKTGQGPELGNKPRLGG